MYKYNIKGFCNGDITYYSQDSRFKIDPFIYWATWRIPSGDAFSIPGKGPIASMRLKIFKHALQDMQTLKLLKDICQEDIIKMIDSEKYYFQRLSSSAEFILNLREKVNEAISNFID